MQVFSDIIYSRPPFQITGISKSPIVGANDEGFYSGSTVSSKTNYVVFPMSIHIEGEENITIVYGRHDRDSWVVVLDRKGALESLEVVG